MKQNSIYVFMIITLICLLGCQMVFWGEVPEGEIIYQWTVVKQGTFPGFINADGSNNMVTDTDRLQKPVWSVDGKFIYGLSRGISPYDGYPSYWDLENGRFKVCSRNSPSFDQIRGWENPQHPEEVIVENTWTITVYDISRCEQMHSLVDYSTQPGYFAIQGFSYSSSRQELIYGLVVDPSEDREYQLMRLDLKTGEVVQLAEGINPAWSPDRTQIAYIGLDGLYILELSGNEVEPKKLLDQPFFDPWRSGSPWTFVTIPSWSPDGKSLVYHRCGTTVENCIWEDAQIYIFNLATGQEVSILKGGEYPSWRP